MGTNYYLKPAPPCYHCSRGYEGAHIGKKSGGWRFLWAPIPEDAGAFTTTQRTWLAYLEGRAIQDEYGQDVEPEEFRAMACDPSGQVLTRQNIGSYGNPLDYERIGPDGERIAVRAGFS